jgi:hypothetical protein
MKQRINIRTSLFPSSVSTSLSLIKKLKLYISWKECRCLDRFKEACIIFQEYKYCLRFVVLIAVKISAVVFWVVTLCRVDHEDGGDAFLWNTGSNIQDYHSISYEHSTYKHLRIMNVIHYNLPTYSYKNAHNRDTKGQTDSRHIPVQRPSPKSTVNSASD